MRFIGILVSLLLLALLAYWLIKGISSSFRRSPIENAAPETGITEGAMRNGEEIKRRVEEMIQKNAETQEKALHEATQ